MKKTALIFLLAIFLPALILGGLALRTASQQRIILEQQETELRQAETDRVAAAIREALSGEQQGFVQAVERLVAGLNPETAARDFASRLHEAWPRKCVGFAVTTGGQILSPTTQQARKDPPAGEFLRDNKSFIGGEIAAEVYQTQQLNREEAGGIEELKSSARLGKDAAADKSESAPQSFAMRSRSAESSQAARGQAEPQEKPAAAAPPPQFETKQKNIGQYRKVAPQKIQPNVNEQQLASQLNVATSRFSQLVSSGRNGLLARFVEDQLEVIFWARPARDESIVFGAQIDPRDLRDLIEPLLVTPPSYSLSRGSDACLAVLDDRAKPFALSMRDFVARWKTPFVATEIGEALPHWEVTLYLVDPDRLARSARLVNYTLIGLIALALAAIASGSFLVVADTRRQLALVQKKTDFVSNVSHELKTPLTSIRMFAELLHEKRVQDPEKVSSYLRIITLESERLTRLINNVLDFARMERGQKRYHKRALDLHSVITKLWEAQELHLRGQGFETVWHAAPGPYRVFGDEDALAQVIVNLLSNAEKYSGENKSVELHSYIDHGHVCVSVLDRGIGVPAGEERKIFEHFYRAHDSLSSGIQGSGLGLTLAQKIAEEHGGTIRYAKRADGGSSFTLELPEQAHLEIDS